ARRGLKSTRQRRPRERHLEPLGVAQAFEPAGLGTLLFVSLPRKTNADRAVQLGGFTELGSSVIGTGARPSGASPPVLSWCQGNTVDDKDCATRKRRKRRVPVRSHSNRAEYIPDQGGEDLTSTASPCHLFELFI